MTFSPKVRVRARVRLRPKWDDEDGDCNCTPLWQELLVALLPVVATGALELFIDRKKAEDRAERKRRDYVDRNRRKEEGGE